MAAANTTTCSAPGCNTPSHYIASALCAKHYQRLRITGSLDLGHKPSAPVEVCSVPECPRISVSKRMCHKHYQRLRTTGSLELIERHPPRECPCCGIMFKAQKTRVYCSKKCYGLSSRVREYDFHCAYCHKVSGRRIGSRDIGKYCSRECYFLNKGMVKAEVAWIRRIHARRATISKARESLRHHVVGPEVAALKRIGARIRERSRICGICSISFVRRIAFNRYCSRDCEGVARSAQAERQRVWRRESAGKYKKARRARLKGSGEAQNINPLRVFERDGWRCHICNNKTPKKYRGTFHDRAPELEHMVSLADGGSHTWGNVACSCRSCNQAKGASSYGQLGFDMAV